MLLAQNDSFDSRPPPCLPDLPLFIFPLKVLELWLFPKDGQKWPGSHVSTGRCDHPGGHQVMPINVYKEMVREGSQDGRGGPRMVPFWHPLFEI